MFFNKLTYFLTITLLLVAGFICLATPATAAVVPRLAVTDEVEDVEENADTQGIQVYGLRTESVSFDLTVTFQTTDPSPVNTRVTGFGDDDGDIVLVAVDSGSLFIENGATFSPIQRKDNGSVYTTTITASRGVAKVFIQVPTAAATTVPIVTNGIVTSGTPTDVAASTDLHNILTDNDNKVQLVVNIVRKAAPPLIVSPDRSIGGNAPFTMTLTSTRAITLTRADLKITGGSIDSLSPDTARRVWTVTIRPGVAITQITVEPATNGSFGFPKGTFTVDTIGPVATITPVPISGGVYSATIAFDESLQTGSTLISSEIAVIGASIGVLSPIPSTNSYVATLIPDAGATSVTVQVKAGAVADAGGVQNTATPSPAHTFRVAATGAPTPDPTPEPDPTIGRGNVAISEIMFATDGGADEIQWIELFNSSKTETVALDAGAGWELIIENYDSRRTNEDPLSGTINFKDEGAVKTIKPRQTVLIVSTNGRNSDRTHFVSTRVFDVYAELRDEFGMGSRRDPFLHPTKGFHIQLVDERNSLVDEVGNLDGRIRTADEPAWELPDGWTEDGDRTSIIRRYRRYNPRTNRYTNKGVALDGTLQASWIRAAATPFLDLLEKDIETYYGIKTDKGSPGIRAGGALPVQLSQFRPNLTETGTVVIQWTTESEVDNAGFNILRSQTRRGEFKIINTQLIPGAGTTAERNTYTWTDTTAKPNLVYYYQIEDVSFGGEHQTLVTVRLRGLVSAKGKLATQWGQLKRSRD